MKRVLLAISNQAYCRHLVRMLKSLYKFHPQQESYALLVNVPAKSKKQILEINKHIHIIEEKINFPTEADEKGFLVCSRTWYIKKLMEQLKTSVFYCDADVVFLDDVSPFFEWLDDFDFAARVKTFKPKVRVNAGILWCKYTPNNLKLIDYWIKRTKKIGIKWMSDQLAFNDMVNKYRHEMKFSGFPAEYSGLDNKISKIKHYKGTRGKKKLEGEKNE